MTATTLQLEQSKNTRVEVQGPCGGADHELCSLTGSSAIYL